VTDSRRPPDRRKGIRLVPERKQDEPKPSNPGLNALGWVAAVLIVLFVLGIAQCQVRVEPHLDSAATRSSTRPS
jgi:hypothetical protein